MTKAVSLIAIATAIATLLFVSRKQPQIEFDQEEFIEKFTDKIVDTGFASEFAFSEERDLDTRLIITTTDVNASFAHSLIRKLILLDRIDPESPIDIYIRTEGGWEADIISVIDTMRALRAKVNVHAIGDVHSAGLMLLAAATGERIVYPNTILGYHAFSKDENAIYIERYLHFWDTYAKLPESWLKLEDSEFVYFGSDKAIEYGVADTVLPEKKPGLTDD